MKMIIFLMAIISYSPIFSQEIKNHSLNKIFSMTPNGYLPFQTVTINYDSTIMLNENIVVNGLFSNDTSETRYILEYYDNDAFKNSTISKKYTFRSVAKFNLNKYQLLIFKRLGNNISKVMLYVFSEALLIDSIMIGYELGGGETEIVEYVEGEILEDFTIKTKSCVMNSDYSAQKRKENPNYPRSIVTLSLYKIDFESGKINLISVEKKYSKCIPEEFTYKNCNCQLLDYP